MRCLAAPLLSSAASAALPACTASCTTASACGTPRSSSSAAANGAGRAAASGGAAGRRAGGLLGGPDDEALDPPVGGHRLVQRVARVLDAGPVVRLAQVVAQLGGPHLGHHRVHEQRVAQRLAHLLAGDADQAVVHPVPGEAVADRGGLGPLVLVVREDQVQAAAVDVEGRRPGTWWPWPSTPGASPGGPGPTGSPRTARPACGPSTARSPAGRAWRRCPRCRRPAACARAAARTGSRSPAGS